MYSRNYGNGGRYDPPPGYTGSTFAEPEVKRHPPEESGEIQPRRNRGLLPVTRRDHDEYGEHSDGHAALEELIHSLRGKIGAEELLILLVMLLTASDGVGIETVILAAALLAGDRDSDRADD